MLHRNRDLYLTMAATLSAIAVQYTSPLQTGWVYWITGTYLALVSPGLGLSMALQLQTGRAARIPVILGLSLISVIAGALVLNLTPAGLRPASWATLLGTITLAGCLAAAVRRRRGHASLTAADSPRQPGRIRSVVKFALAAGLAATALVIAFIGASHAKGPGFTALWAMPAGSAGKVTVGLSNQEDSDLDCVLSIRSGAATLQTRQIVLDRNSSWEEPMDVSTKPLEPLKIELSREDRPGNVYRSVILYPETFLAAGKSK